MTPKTQCASADCWAENTQKFRLGITQAGKSPEEHEIHLCQQCAGFFSLVREQAQDGNVPWSIRQTATTERNQE